LEEPVPGINNLQGSFLRANDAEFTYGPFGETTATGSGDASAPQYTGRENDGTGLYYYRARYYSPRLQRFISEDPIGFAGGSTNLYAYVGNSPTNRTDPSGLLWDIFIDFGFVIYDVYVLATDSEKNFTTNALALTADVAGILVPFGAGFGVAVRAGRAVKGAGTHADDVVRLYHQGNLRNGRVSSNRYFSTSPSSDLSHYHPDEALQEFEVPRDVFNQWDADGSIQHLTDMHQPTGTITPEVRIFPPAAGQMNDFIVRPPGG